MLRVVLNNLRCCGSLENFIERDVLLNHLLMGVHSNAQLSRYTLGTYPLKH